MSTEIKGILEIDSDRGVIYFHPVEEMSLSEGVWGINPIPPGSTQLRICRLPTPIPTNRPIDITHMHGTDWEGVPE